MAATVAFFNKFKHALGNGQIDLDSDSFKIELHTSTFAPDIDAMSFRSDLTNESSGAGYSAGGQALTSKSWTQDNGNDRATWDFDDITFSTVTISFRYAVIYKVVGSAGTDILVGYIDYGATQTVSGIDVVLPINAAGFMALRQAP